MCVCTHAHSCVIPVLAVGSIATKKGEQKGEQKEVYHLSQCTLSSPRNPLSGYTPCSSREATSNYAGSQLWRPKLLPHSTEEIQSLKREYSSSYLPPHHLLFVVGIFVWGFCFVLLFACLLFGFFNIGFLCIVLDVLTGLTWMNSPCRPGWSWAQRDPPTSTSRVLGLKSMTHHAWLSTSPS